MESSKETIHGFQSSSLECIIFFYDKLGMCIYYIFNTVALLSNVFWVCAAIWLPTTSYSIVRTTGAYWSHNIIWKSLYMLQYLFENVGRMDHFQFCQYFLCGKKIVLCFLHFYSKSILGNKDNGGTKDSTYCDFRFTCSQKTRLIFQLVELITIHAIEELKAITTMGMSFGHCTFFYIGCIYFSLIQEKERYFLLNISAFSVTQFREFSVLPSGLDCLQRNFPCGRGSPICKLCFYFSTDRFLSLKV